MGEMGGMMGGGWMALGAWISLLLGLGLLALVIIGIVAGIRWLIRDATPPALGRDPDRALELLRERYARGEISREEFQRMRQDLS
jgi:putative membrane protein